MVAPPNITRTRRPIGTKTMSSAATGRGSTFSITRSSRAFAMAKFLLDVRPTPRTMRGAAMFHSIERDDQQPAENRGVLEELRPLPLAIQRVVDLPESVPGNRGRNHRLRQRQRGKRRHHAVGQEHPD